MANIIDPEKERTEEEKKRYAEIIANCSEDDREYAKMVWTMGVPIEMIESSCGRKPGESEKTKDGKMSQEEVKRRMCRNAIAYLAFDENDF